MSDLLPLSRNAEALRRLFDRGHVLTRKQAEPLLGVTDRQVSRLLDELRAADVPVQSKPDPQGSRAKAYYLAPEHQRRGVVLGGLDEEALYALSVAAEASRAALAGTPLDAPLERGLHALLGAVSALPDDTGHEAGPDTFEVEAVSAGWHFGSGLVEEPDPGLFSTVRRAVVEQQAVRIDYRRGDGTPFRGREVEPLALVRYRGAWRLVAWCKLREGLREFTLARMTNVRPVSRYFLRPDGFDLRAFLAGRFGALEGGDPVEVVLRVSAERATYFQSRRYHPSQEIEMLEDGALRVCYQVPGGAGLDEVAAWVRSWGPHVIVEAPASLAQQVAEDARKTAAAYADAECPSSEEASATLPA
ncbi:MAG: WYL domain-containing protein [Bacteroidota bacterium]